MSFEDQEIFQIRTENRLCDGSSKLYVPLKQMEKLPSNGGWTNTPCSWEELQSHLGSGGNLGLLLGTKTGYIDVDCDCLAAVELARRVLPKPAGHFARNGESAHYIYQSTSEELETLRFQQASGTIIELRGNGAQTMIPPSIHPSGQQLEWAGIDSGVAYQDYSELKMLVSAIAASVVLIDHWNEGSRHDLALGFSGWLRKVGVGQEQVSTLVEGICELTGDMEISDRLTCVETTFAQSVGSVSGYRTLADVLPDDSIRKISGWLQNGHEMQLAQPNLTAIDGNSAVGLQKLISGDLTEARLADAFAKWGKNRAAYVVDDRTWWIWNGRTWEQDQSGRIRQQIIELLRVIMELMNSARANDLGKILNMETIRKVEGVAKLAQPLLERKRVDFDVNPILLNTRNGILDLEHASVCPSNPEALQSQILNVEYDPLAECPRFEAFVNDICCEDTELVEFLQRVAGYCLRGDNPDQVMFFLYGYGANGKSTFVNALMNMLGSYGRAAPISTLIQQGSRSVGDDLLYLEKARLISASESEGGEALAEAKVKQLTGGDTLSGRKLYGNYADFKVGGKILFSTNTLPRIQGMDHGIWRRLIIIDFKRRFAPAEQDKSLGKALKSEANGILNWALQGHLAYLKDGLRPPISVIETGERLREERDTVGRFLKDECMIDAGLRTSPARLRHAYDSWCERNGERAVSPHEMKSYLESNIGLTQTRTGRGRAWVGIDLKELAEIPF